jgi:hypothetical protein
MGQERSKKCWTKTVHMMMEFVEASLLGDIEKTNQLEMEEH